MNRRQFLKRGLLGGLILTAGGVGLHLWPAARKWPPQRPLHALDERTFAVLAAISARTVVVAGADPAEIAHRCDMVLSRVPEEARRDFVSLLRVFETPLGGLLDARVRPFTHLSDEAQDRILEAWRDSHITLRRVGYQALRKLTLGQHYGSPEVWASVGYPGPPTLPGAGGAP